jgi:CRP-like cAMP-binding protein
MQNHKDLDQKIKTIGRHPIFKSNSSDELAPLARAAEWLGFRRGEMIFRQGDAPHHAHIVHTGRVKVFKTSVGGQAFITMIAGPHNTLNAVTCFGCKPRFFSAEALEDVRLVAIPTIPFVDFVFHHPATAQAVITTMGTHQMSAIDRIMDLIEEGVEQRILNILSVLSKRLGPCLPLTNIDLAELAGTTRETAARVVSRLDTMGLVVKCRGRVEILNAALLKQMASHRNFFL